MQTRTLSSEDWVPLYLESETRVRTLVNLAELLGQSKDYTATQAIVTHLQKFDATDRQRYQGRLYYLQGQNAYATECYSEAVEWFQRWLQASRRAAPSRRQGIAHFNVAVALEQVGSNPVRIIEHFQEARRIFERTDSAVECGLTDYSMARTYLTTGDFTHAFEAYQKAEAILTDTKLLAEIALGKSICTWGLQGPDNGYLAFQKLPDAFNEPDQKARAYHNLGVISRQRNRIPKAFEYLEQALLYHPQPDQRMATTLAELCLCHLLAGQTKEASRQWDTVFRGCHTLWLLSLF